MKTNKQTFTKKLLAGTIRVCSFCDHSRMVLAFDYLTFRMKRERMIKDIPDQMLPLRSRRIIKENFYALILK